MKSAITFVTKGYRVALPNSDARAHPELFWKLWMHARNRIEFPLRQFASALDPNSNSFTASLVQVFASEGVALIDTSKSLDKVTCWYVEWYLAVY